MEKIRRSTIKNIKNVTINNDINVPPSDFFEWFFANSLLHYLLLVEGSIERREVKVHLRAPSNWIRKEFAFKF